MKQVPCAYSACGDRRIHHEDPDTPRGTQLVKVPDGHRGPAFCSITCSMLAERFTIRYRIRKAWRWLRGWTRCLNEHPDGGAFCKRRPGHLGRHANANWKLRW